VARTLRSLDLVFYQSRELLERAADLLQVPPREMSAARHAVLARGIVEPPIIAREELRARARAALRVPDGELLVLNIGRVSRAKGIYELITAVSAASTRHRGIHCVVLGSLPSFDETLEVGMLLDGLFEGRRPVRLLPACAPERVWEHLCAADIFAFTSHHEGMPNSLLEAMVMGVPAIAFAIPPVVEIDAGRGALVTIPPFDTARFAEAVVRLASASPDERARLGAKGKARVADAFMAGKNMHSAVGRIAQIVDRRTARTGSTREQGLSLAAGS